MQIKLAKKIPYSEKNNERENIKEAQEKKKNMQKRMVVGRAARLGEAANGRTKPRARKPKEKNLKFIFIPVLKIFINIARKVKNEK